MASSRDEAREAEGEGEREDFVCFYDSRTLLLAAQQAPALHQVGDDGNGNSTSATLAVVVV
jgi:hypothetical protein